MPAKTRALPRSELIKQRKKGATAMLFMFAVLILSVLASQKVFANSSFVPELQPNPEYQPDEVVGIQMRALGNNDKPFADAGIELTFRFASPSNKASTGPLERFAGLFSIPAYKSMLNHAALKIGKAEIRNDQARVPVTIESGDGKQIVYLFALSLQSEEPYMNCWMTDSVTPIEIKQSDSPVIM